MFLKRVQPFKDENKAHIIVAVDQRPLNYDPPDEGMLGLSRELISIEIPSRPPLTRQEFSKARAFWPCHFHEDKRLESVLNRTLKDVWGDLCMEIHCQNMVETLDLKVRSKAKVAAIAFDPITTRRVAMAFDRENKSLRHAAMNLIDSVAHSHGGGAWPLVLQVQPDENEKCYLLTGYDVYLTQEPCLMCSMALVHSRVSRVFFMEPSPQKGGLYSLCRLQNVRSLNHAFEVFQIKPQGAT